MSLIPNFRQTFNKHYLRPRSLGPIQRFRIPFLIALHIRENSAFINTRIDWKETPEAHVFKADISGQKKEEVKAKIEDDRVLQISRETKIEKEDKNGKWHRIDRIIDKFSRKFRLLENAKVNEIKAAIYGAWGSQCDCS